MVKRNAYLAQVTPSYLFSQIGQKKRDFLRSHPEAHLLDLSIGNTTVPLHQKIAQALSSRSLALATAEGYTGYGSELGDTALRTRIAEKIYKERISSDEITISDGSKCAISRLQALFGPSVRVGIQDPSYPVFIDGSRIHGVSDIELFPCTPETAFFPDLESAHPVDLLYICSPNNPTGIAYTHHQLARLVAYAREHSAIIIFDAAYAAFIQDPSLPRSIYEIEGAREVAIEVGSFSKMSGFTGLRLGWVVVPQELTYSDGRPVRPDWERIVTTLFNGASSLIQHGGIEAIEYEPSPVYMETSAYLRSLFANTATYGGENAPYLWIGFPHHSSWETFDWLLREYHVVSTPGIGFGPSGESFIRLSAFQLGCHDHPSLEKLRSTASLLTT